MMRPERVLMRMAVGIACAGTIAVGSMALAHSGVKDKTVLARMDAMKALSEQTKILGDMARGKRAFDADAAKSAAAQIAQNAAMTPQMFETEAQDPKSEALPAIWEDFADFVERSEALEQAAQSLAARPVTQACLDEGMRRISATCKACHEVYRE